MLPGMHHTCTMHSSDSEECVRRARGRGAAGTSRARRPRVPAYHAPHEGRREKVQFSGRDDAHEGRREKSAR
eukprot:COSAG02_NODE_2424_length_8891_cov_566.577912_7_plen_72_part_00